MSGQRAEATDRRGGRILGTARRVQGASGAVGAQMAQALASLVLSIAAARALGANGLGVFGLISGGLVVATALATGLVGDSLTVLDRHDPRVRAGLEVVGFSCAALAGVLGCVITRATGLLDWQTAFVFGLGSAFFIFEEFLRRLLMASLRFWSVMVVDVSCLDRDRLVARRRQRVGLDRHDADPARAVGLADRRHGHRVQPAAAPRAVAVSVAPPRRREHLALRQLARRAAGCPARDADRDADPRRGRRGNRCLRPARGRARLHRADAADRQRRRWLPVRDVRVAAGAAARPVDAIRRQGCGRARRARRRGRRRRGGLPRLGRSADHRPQLRHRPGRGRRGGWRTRPRPAC